MELSKLAFDGVKEVIINNDPVGLIDGGSPEDEYDDQINKIVAILREETDVNSLAEKVNEVFKAEFGEQAKADNNIYLNISSKLFELKAKLRW